MNTEPNRQSGDLPVADGMISDDELNQISGETDTRPTGQDKSTHNREDQIPTSGVGAVRSSSQPLNQTIADISGEKES